MKMIRKIINTIRKAFDEMTVESLAELTAKAEII